VPERTATHNQQRARDPENEWLALTQPNELGHRRHEPCESRSRPERHEHGRQHAANQGRRARKQRAAFWAGNARERYAGLGREDFCRSFPMRSDAMRGRVLRALEQLGF